jgi:hypothetical protein
MASRAEAKRGDLYEEDFAAWVERQVGALRALAASGAAPPDLDLAHLIEEVEDLGKNIRDEVESRVTVALAHLLKLEFSPAAEPRRGWRATVINQRTHLARRLTATLRRHVRDRFDDLYRDARIDAADDLEVDGMSLDHLPAEPPYTLEQVTQRGWWPRNRHGLDSSEGGRP